MPRACRASAVAATSSSMSRQVSTASWNATAGASGRSRTWRDSQFGRVSSASIRDYINRMDEALILARVQFGLNIGFHILFPTITIGLAWILVYLRVRVERARDASDRAAWLATYKLWVKIFALSF